MIRVVRLWDADLEKSLRERRVGGEGGVAQAVERAAAGGFPRGERQRDVRAAQQGEILPERPGEIQLHGSIRGGDAGETQRRRSRRGFVDVKRRGGDGARVTAGTVAESERPGAIGLRRKQTHKSAVGGERCGRFPAGFSRAGTIESARNDVVIAQAGGHGLQGVGGVIVKLISAAQIRRIAETIGVGGILKSTDAAENREVGAGGRGQENIEIAHPFMVHGDGEPDGLDIRRQASDIKTDHQRAADVIGGAIGQRIGNIARARAGKNAGRRRLNEQPSAKRQREKPSEFRHHKPG